MVLLKLDFFFKMMVERKVTITYVGVHGNKGNYDITF